MNAINHTIEINASKEKVWKVLWDDLTFKDWANIIDEGSYMVGNLQEGDEVNFISGSSGYGVTSRVEKLILYKHVTFRQTADIKIGSNGEIENRDKQWAGATEHYDLEEYNGNVKLTITQDVPIELAEYFQSKLPKVLERVKVLAETK